MEFGGSPQNTCSNLSNGLKDSGHLLPLHGLCYAFALVSLGFLGSLAETHSFFQLNLAGMKAKTALTSAIFRKALNMKQPRGKKEGRKTNIKYTL
jgi:hypothetical protein